MTGNTKRLVFNLPEADAAALEALRVRWGLRTYAETLRRLIRGELVAVPGPQAPKRPSLGKADTSLSPGFSLPVGPVARKPGDMLKKR